MRTPMLMPATSAALLTVHARTLLTSTALRARVESLLRSDKRLRGCRLSGEDTLGFQVEGPGRASAVRFTVRRLNDKINRVELTFDRADTRVAGRLLDLLMPDVVEEIALEIFRRAHADKSQRALISWPKELLAA